MAVYHNYVDGDIYYAEDANLNVRASTGTGLMFQAGTGVTDGSGNLTVTFPTAFTASPVVVGTAQSSNVIVSITAKSATQVTFHASSLSGGGTTGIESNTHTHSDAGHTHGAGSYACDDLDGQHTHTVGATFSSSSPVSYIGFASNHRLCDGSGSSYSDIGAIATSANSGHEHDVDGTSSTGYASIGTQSSNHTHSYSVGWANAGGITINWIAYGAGI